MMSLEELLQSFTLNGDGVGFWDEYKSKQEWLGKPLGISIAARSVSPEIPDLLDELLNNQSAYDNKWKRFAARNILQERKAEWNNLKLSEDIVANTLLVCDLTFGFDADAFFCVWLIAPGIKCEHGVQVYGDRQGNPIRVAME